MRWRALWLSALLVIGTGTLAAAMTVLDAAMPLAQQAIQLAIPEAQQRGLDIAEYQTIVYQTNEGLVVGFYNPGPRPTGCRGNCGPLPELEVKMDAAATRVVLAHYVR